MKKFTEIDDIKILRTVRRKNRGGGDRKIDLQHKLLMISINKLDIIGLTNFDISNLFSILKSTQTQITIK